MEATSDLLGVRNQKKLMPEIFWMYSRAQECTAIDSGREETEWRCTIRR
jgi:hypothetical protein